MNNIFNQVSIQTYYFIDTDTLNNTSDLWYYLTDNLFVENIILKFDLRNALKTNANGEYI
jgi:hypothetical protein